MNRTMRYQPLVTRNYLRCYEDAINFSNKLLALDVVRVRLLLINTLVFPVAYEMMLKKLSLMNDKYQVKRSFIAI